MKFKIPLAVDYFQSSKFLILHSSLIMVFQSYKYELMRTGAHIYRRA